jgi:hypothetical protein
MRIAHKTNIATSEEEPVSNVSKTHIAALDRFVARQCVSPMAPMPESHSTQSLSQMRKHSWMQPCPLMAEAQIRMPAQTCHA